MHLQANQVLLLDGTQHMCMQHSILLQFCCAVYLQSVGGPGSRIRCVLKARRATGGLFFGLLVVSDTGTCYVPPA